MSALRKILLGALVLSSAVCVAQTAESPSRPPSDDLKGPRANIDRLVQLTQEMEKNQKTMISLERIQIYESRLGVLETRDDGLAQQETELDSQVSTLQRAYSTTEAGIGPTGIPRESGPDPALRTTTTQQYETARRQLDIIRSKKQQVESEMTTLRARLAALQTSLDADTTN